MTLATALIDDPTLEQTGFLRLHLPDRCRAMRPRGELDVSHAGQLRSGMTVLMLTVAPLQGSRVPVYVQAELQGHALGTQPLENYTRLYYPVPADVGATLAGHDKLRLVLSAEAQATVEGPLSLVFYDARLVDLNTNNFGERDEFYHQIKMFTPAAPLASSVLTRWQGGDLPARGAAPNVLDIGAGMGWTSALLALWTGGEVWGIDLHDYHGKAAGFGAELKTRMARHTPWLRQGLALMASLTAEALDAGCDRCRFVTHTAERLPFRDRMFRYVFSHNAFEHIMDPAAALAEIERVLEPGGEALILSYLLYHCDGGSHLHATGLFDEPWAQLRFSTEEIVARVTAAGRPPQEIAPTLATLNGWSIGQFEKLFRSSRLKVVDLEISEGFTVPGAGESKAFAELQRKYARRDLVTIGFCAHLRKG